MSFLIISMEFSSSARVNVDDDDDDKKNCINIKHKVIYQTESADYKCVICQSVDAYI